ncbi:MAG: 2-nitropropane dioxygenase [Mycetocola sp.]
MTSTPTTPDVSIRVRLHFGRAAVQLVAVQAGIDLLHLKGNATDPSLREAEAAGTDVDILVRPSQVRALHAAILIHGWELYSTFEDGSPFAHAQTYLHPQWGYLDVHRRFPGIGLDDEAAFSRLWEFRSSTPFCDIPCDVPSVAAQAVILMLNAARTGRTQGVDLERAWFDASVDARISVDEEVEKLDARLAFDAAQGELERHRGEREYRLWKAVSRRGGRLEEWWGRLLAAPSIRAKATVLVRAGLVNVEHLGHRLGHAPSRGEIVREFFARPARGAWELRPRRARHDR